MPKILKKSFCIAFSLINSCMLCYQYKKILINGQKFLRVFPEQRGSQNRFLTGALKAAA